jgi:hypothetical protein
MNLIELLLLLLLLLLFVVSDTKFILINAG